MSGETEPGPSVQLDPSRPVVGIWHNQSSNTLFHDAMKIARNRGQEMILGGNLDVENPFNQASTKDRNNTWTTVTSDRQLVDHLLALYFCWEYPTFASLSKEHFIKGFREGNHRYCSPLLVNALCALGSRFSDLPNFPEDSKNNATIGDQFFAEALRLFGAEQDHRTLTTIQSLSLMSIREATCGRIREAMFFSGQSIRLAIEKGLHLDAEDEDEDEDGIGDEEGDGEADEVVRKATFWGAFSLNE